MALNILSKRVAEVSDLPVKDANGTPLLDENNAPVTATVFGPGTKIWQVANAMAQRKSIKRTREANGKWEASVDNSDEDDIEFLCAITKRFNNLVVEGVEGERETVTAVYGDPLLGFIRDHMKADTKNWENFMKAAQSLSTPGSVSTSG